MATKATLKPTIVRYTVGDDLTPEQYHDLIDKIGLWFAKIRNTKEPHALAKQVIDACLAGVKPSDGTPWDAVATVSLAKRIRIACRFDMESMKPLESAGEKSKKKKENEKKRAEKKKADQGKDDNYPDEYKGGVVPSELTYGDDPLLFFTTKEVENREVLRAGFLKEFPQLNNIAAQGKLDMMLDLMILQQRLRFRNAQPEKKGNVRATENEMQQMTKQIVELEKAMGIDPVSINKMQKEREGGSIGDAVRRFQTMGDYVPLRLMKWAEELLIMYQAFMQPSPRSSTSGYQLDEVGLYGLTKSRVIECPKCGIKNFAGLTIEEIEAYLIKEGYLVPVGDKVPGEYLQLTDAQDRAES